MTTSIEIVLGAITGLVIGFFNAKIIVNTAQKALSLKPGKKIPSILAITLPKLVIIGGILCLFLYYKLMKGFWAAFITMVISIHIFPVLILKSENKKELQP